MGSSYSVPDHPTKHLHEWVKSLPSMEGRTVAVTGTTTGMGFIAAREILRKGGNVILLNRPSERAQKALERLQGNTTSGSCNAIDCDLQNFASVRDAAKAVENKASGGLDVLCNNAGVPLCLGVNEAMLQRYPRCTCGAWFIHSLRQFSSLQNWRSQALVLSDLDFKVTFSTNGRVF